MNSMLMMMANLMPEDMLIEALEKSIKEYKLLKTADTKLRMELDMTVLQTKYAIESEGGIEQLQNRFDKMEKGEKFMTVNQQ